MRFGRLIFASVVVLMTVAADPAMAQSQPGGTSSGTAVPDRFKLAAAHPAFEWFFLLVDAGTEHL